MRATPGTKRPCVVAERCARAFTLIELLVVAAVIAVLAALLLPALAAAKERGRMAACLNNVRQLHLAWQFYAEENGDRLVNNHGREQTRLERNTWANHVQDWLDSDDNTNPVWLTEAKLGPYVGRVTGVYKCPSDRSPAENGPRLRSYSMNSLVGDPGVLTNRFNPAYVQFFKGSDILFPSRIFVFLEEHPDTINDGFFMNRLDEPSPTWGNLPASSHRSSANLSFADGHVETHRWVVDGPNGTIRPPVKGAVGGTFPASPTTDFDWLKEHSSVRRSGGVP